MRSDLESTLLVRCLPQATFGKFMTVAAKQDMTVQNLFTNTAYLLRGTLREEIYMQKPSEFVKDGKEQMVFMLQHSINGLHQSAHCWNRKLDEVLVKNGSK